MLTHDGTSDDSASTRARVIVSLNYVQVLRREIEAGRISQTMFEDYLARLESHLLNIERSSLVASDDAPKRLELCRRHARGAAPRDDEREREQRDRTKSGEHHRLECRVSEPEETRDAKRPLGTDPASGGPPDG